MLTAAVAIMPTTDILPKEALLMANVKTTAPIFDNNRLAVFDRKFRTNEGFFGTKAKRSSMVIIPRVAKNESCADMSRTLSGDIRQIKITAANKEE